MLKVKKNLAVQLKKMILNLARIQEEIILMLKRKLQKMKIKLMEQKIILRKKRILRMRFSRKF